MNQDPFVRIFQEAVLNTTAARNASGGGNLVSEVSPETAYKTFVTGVSHALSDLIAQKMAEAVASVLTNPSINTEIGGVNWMKEYVVGRPIGLDYSWTTPGFASPMNHQNYIASGDDGNSVNALGVSVTVMGSISF